MKDARVFLTFDDGMSTAINVQGYVEELMHTGTGELSSRVVNGKEQFLKDAETKIFLVLGDFARRYKDIKEIHFAETDREE